MSTSLDHAAAALQKGDVALARRTCDSWLKGKPRDVTALHLRGRCMAALGSMEPAVEDFRRALAIEPNHFLALADLGIALAALGRHEEAAGRLSAALAQDGSPAELHFALGQSQLACGHLRAAAGSFTAAINRKPQFADAYVNLGVVFDRAGDAANAMRCFEQARLLEPRLTQAHRNLADVLRRNGRAAEALQVLRQAAAAQPQNSELLCEISESLSDAGLWDDAIATARAATSQAPQSARAHAAAGMALLGADQCAQAADTLERALQLDAGLGYAAVNLGEALRRLQRPEQAAAAYRRAGGSAEAHMGLGRTLTMLGDFPGAARSFHDAYAARPTDAALAVAVAAGLEEVGFLEAAKAVLEEAPKDAGVFHALGALLHRRGRFEEALTNYDRALATTPGDLQLVLDRGYALESLGRLEEATAAYERALALDTGNAQALAGLVSCGLRTCAWVQAESALGALEAIPEGLDALHPFLLLATRISPEETLRVLQRRACHLTVQPPPPRYSHSRLRVAYISPDFREHAVAHSIVSVIENHDRGRVQPIGVCLARADDSDVGKRVCSAFEVVLDASAMTDREVVSRLRELEVDIAVDLAGFTVGARTGILAARCAPVQVNYLGFPSTMGTTFMDYIIADDVVLPESDANLCSERILRLRQCYHPLDCTRIVGTEADRAAAGLPAHGTVFCAFNNSHKITREMFEVWMSVLREVPDSVLWLRGMSAVAADNLKRAAEELGVSSSRVIFAAYAARMEEYLGRLRLADLFLDTLPYNAHTTAADALWAGVPVVSCRGKTFASRVGASMLTSAGLPDLICSSVDEYRAKAIRLATQPEELRAIRDRLASARESAPVFDIPLYTRSLEALYEKMYAS
jgi:predicted O-linked N-acetylglucosamine transferase (SPINDLY family)